MFLLVQLGASLLEVGLLLLKFALYSNAADQHAFLGFFQLDRMLPTKNLLPFNFLLERHDAFGVFRLFSAQLNKFLGDTISSLSNLLGFRLQSRPFDDEFFMSGS
jgi:hypothetical protein